MTEVLQKSQEVHNDRLTSSALTLGRDYFEATGQLPEKEHFEAFFCNDYFDYDPNEITSGPFSNWHDFQDKISEELELYRLDKEAEIQKILGLIDLEKQIGVIDPHLLLETREKDGVYTFIDRDVPDEEKIKRYYTFKVIEKMTSDFDNTDLPLNSKLTPLVRRTNITLGYNIDTGKKGKTVFSAMSSLKDRTFSEVAIEFELVASDEGWLDYVEPELRQNYLAEVIDASKDKHYQLPLPADTRLYEALNADFYIDTAKHRIMLSRPALSEVIETNHNTGGIASLGSLLLQKEVPLRLNERANRDKYRELTKEDTLRYGQWLLNAIGINKQDSFNANILHNSYHLGLGPSAHTIRSKNGNLANYFKELDVRHRVPKGHFDNWQIEDYLNFLKRVANENGGRVTVNILRDRAKKRGSEYEPDRYTLATKVPGGLTALLEELNMRPHNIHRDPATIINEGLEFVEINGRVPKKKDLDSDPILRSSRTIQRHFGSISNYQKILASKLEKLGQEETSLAA